MRRPLVLALLVLTAPASALAAPAGGGPVPVISPRRDAALGARERSRRPEGYAGDPVAAVRDLGFHIPSLRAEGFPVVPWTVNREDEVRRLLALGASGVITDRPDLVMPLVEAWDDGRLLGPDGLLDRDRFDVQAHRGARGLRPENTLPSMEAALDLLVTSLEMDVVLAADGVLMVSHEPWADPRRCRRLDHGPYGRRNRLLVLQTTSGQIQAELVCDRLRSGLPQVNETSRSPVAVAFAASEGLAHPYVMPTLDQVLDLVTSYVEYYGSGDGASHPEAQRRTANARRVRFSIEVKVASGRSGRTAAPEEVARAVATTVDERGLAGRVDVQSFEASALQVLEEEHPEIRRAYLFRRRP